MYRSISKNDNKQKNKTHEFINEIVCIESLLNSKDYSELETYVKNIGGNLNREFDVIDTNNVIVNAILNTKYQEAMDKKIVFVLKINDLSNLKMKDTDIVIILSNLLNNAIEACAQCNGKRIVKLKFIHEGEDMIISVKNTYEKTPLLENEECKSSKHEKREIGLKNIIETIEKYEGSYMMKDENNEFYFSTIIPLSFL